MVKEKLRSVWIPGISTGIWGFPTKLAAKWMGKAVRDFIINPEYKEDMKNKSIIFCNFDDNTVII